MEELAIMEYISKRSKEKIIKLLQERTKDYENQKLMLNMDLEDEVQIQSSVEGYNFILYCNAKKMIYFSPPKAFFGTVSDDNNQSVIRGKFKLTKSCFSGMISNILAIFILIVGRCVFEFKLIDFISRVIICLIFTLVMIISVELFSIIFRKIAYQKIVDFLAEICMQ